MSSGTKIIQAAFKEIGAHSVAAPAPSESIKDGMHVLNSMLEEWRSLDIELGTVVLKNPGNELSEPLDAKQGIIENLAIRSAPLFDNGKTVVSNELKLNAANSYNTIKSLYQVITIPGKKVSSALPRGEGNRHNSRTYFKNTDTLTDA